MPISDKEAYDALFELLSVAEMEMRNANWWQVTHKLDQAAELARKIATEKQ